MLTDLAVLGADRTMPLSDAVRVLWSADFRHSRQLCQELAAPASEAPSSVRTDDPGEQGRSAEAAAASAS